MTSQGKMSRYWFYYYPFLLALAYSQDALFSASQNTKFISGLALAGYGDIKHDWMAHITDPFPLFSHLLKWQYRLLGLHAGVHLAFIVLVAVYGVAACWLASELFPIESKTGLPQKTLIVFSLLWMLFHAEGIRNQLLHVVPPGLAYQYILGDYYQPCCFGVLLLLGLAAYIARYTWLALVCFAATPLFHPTYLIGSALFATIMVTLPANRALGIDWRRRLLFLLPLMLILIVLSIWNVHALTTGDPAIRREAHRILAESRIQDHALPSHWGLTKIIVFFAVGFAAAWIARRQLLGQLLGVSLFATAVSVLWLVVSFNPTLAVLAPWRVSVFLAPLSWIVLLSALAHWLTTNRYTDWIFRGENIRTPILAIAFLSALIGTVLLAADYRGKKNRPFYAVSHFINEHRAPGDQYLIPIEQPSIRLEAEAPVYISLKSNPTKDSELLAWHKRVVAAYTVYSKPAEVAAAQLQFLQRHDGVTHIVWPNKRGAFPFVQFGRLLFQDAYFSLWDIR